MIRVGFETTHPVTGTRFVVIKGAEETGGKGWVLEVRCPEGAAPSFPEHIHLTWTETFEILSGMATYVLDGEAYQASAGDTILLPPGTRHAHPWNTGTGEMVYRWHEDFGVPNPDAIQDLMGVFATINGMAGEGKLNERGMPRNLLQLAATLRTLMKYQGFGARSPIWFQRIFGATLGRLANLLGYRAVYPRFVE